MTMMREKNDTGDDLEELSPEQRHKLLQPIMNWIEKIPVE